jgi:hypothetical protein
MVLLKVWEGTRAMFFNLNEFAHGLRIWSHTHLGIGFAFLQASQEIAKLKVGEWHMKLKNIIRMQLMLAGLAAAMIFAKPVQAQQEVDPTSFDVTPRQEQMAPSQPVAKGSPVAQTEVPAVPREEAAAASLTSPNANTILALTLGMGTVALLGFVEIRLGKRRRVSSEFSNSAVAN